MNRRFVTCLYLFAAFATGVLLTPGLVAQSANPSVKGVVAAKAQVQAMEIRIEELRHRSRQLRDDIKGVHAGLDQKSISDDSFSDVMKLLQTQRVQLMIDVAGLQARSEAVELGASVSRKVVDNSKLLALLGDAVAIQEAALVRTIKLSQSGAASQDQVHQAERLLLHARVQLEETRTPASSGVTIQGARQLTEIALDLAEKRARLEMIESLLSEHIVSRESVEVIRRMEVQYDSSVQFLQELTVELESAKAELALRAGPAKDN